MRVFVAVEITDEIIIQRITELQSRLDIKAKKVEPHNLHFTLQFLGEVPNEFVKEISTALKKIEFSSFSVNIRGVGVFPKSKPRVVWVGVDQYGGKELSKLAEKVEHVLKPLGFSNDKLFKPHVTILRVKNKITIDKLNMEFGVQRISSIKLKQSVLTKDGPIYTDIEEIDAL